MRDHEGQPAQDTPGWRLWVSATGRHWAIRCGLLTAAQIAAGSRPMLWAHDGAALAALIRAQEELTAQQRYPRHSDRGPGRAIG